MSFFDDLNLMWWNKFRFNARMVSLVVKSVATFGICKCNHSAYPYVID
jgi:hypothetical protein